MISSTFSLGSDKHISDQREENVFAIWQFFISLSQVKLTELNNLVNFDLLFLFLNYSALSRKIIIAWSYH